MTERIIIAGTGGQGIMLLGKVLAETAMRENKHTTYLPSYGAEVRGGTAHCMIIISDAEIGSPHIKKADTLIVMNGPSLNKFKDRIGNNGLLIINSSLAGNNNEVHKLSRTHILKYPFTDIAVELGNIRVANMVALGCYLCKKKALNLKAVLETIQEITPPDKKNLIEINTKALLAGMKLARR